MTPSSSRDTKSLVDSFTQLREKHWLRVGMQRVIWHMENAEYTWDHQSGGNIPGKDMWRVNRFCVQDIVLGLVALRHDRQHNRIEVDVFLTASIPEYEADSGARALSLMILSEAYASGSRMEISFTSYVEGGSIPSDIVALADRLGVNLSQVEAGLILPKEAVDLYVALTGFSPHVFDLMQTLESKGRISRAQICFSIQNGIWERVEVEAILSASPNPGALLGGKNSPEDRYLFLEDLHYGRSALVLGTIDRHLRYRAHLLGDKIALLEDDERSLQINIDGNHFLATFMSPDEEIQLPWVIKSPEGCDTIVYSGQFFSILLRPRSHRDIESEIMNDYKWAERIAAKTPNQYTYLLLARDVEKISPEHRQRLLNNRPPNIGVMVFPEFVSSMDEEVMRRIKSSRRKRE